MENFASNYYNHFKNIPINVLEIGSRDGNDAEYLRNYFNIPHNKVFVVEPNPLSAQNIRTYHPTQKLFEVAISEHVGTLSFNAINNGDPMMVGMSSLLKRRKDTGYSEEENLRSFENWINVQSITGEMLLKLIDENVYDLVKIDVEGATFSTLKSFGNGLKKIKYVHLEAEQRPLWVGEETYDKICKYMTKMGFKESYKVDFSDFGQCDTIWYNTNINE